MRWTLGLRLGLGIILTIIIPLLVVNSIQVYLRVRSLNQKSEESVRLLADLKASEIGQAVHQLEDEVETRLVQAGGLAVFGRALNTASNTTDITMQDEFRSLREGNVIHHVALYHLADTAIVAQQGPETLSLNEQQINELTAIEKTMFTNIRLARNGNFLLADVVVPIRDSTSTEILGDLIVTLNLTELEADDSAEFTNPFAALREQPKLDEVPAAYLGLVDFTGTLIASSAGSANAFQVEYFEHPIVQSVRAGRVSNDVRRYQSPISDEEAIGIEQVFPDNQWILIAEIPENRVLRPLLSSTLPLVVLSFTMILLANSIWDTWLYRSLEPPIRRLIHGLNAFSVEERKPDFVRARRSDEIGALQNAFTEMSAQVYDTVETLRVDNQKQMRNWEIALRSGQLVQQVQNPRLLVEEMARLLQEEILEASYAQIFMVDNEAGIASIQTGTGELGRRLLAQAYHQPLAMENIIGRVALTAQPIVVPNLNKESFYRQSELFDDSISEIVIPIVVENEVSAIIDVHSRKAGAFTEQDLRLFRMISNQMTSAFAAPLSGIERLNARSHSETALAGPRDFLQRRIETLSARAGRAIGPEDNWTTLQRQAMVTQQIAIDTRGDTTVFAIPVRLRQEVLGAVEFVVDSQRFNLTLLQTAEALVSRLALAVDNARLFEQSQRLIERERLVNTITQKLTAQTDVRQILQVAVRELGQALGTPETQISLRIQQ